MGSYWKIALVVAALCLPSVDLAKSQDLDGFAGVFGAIIDQAQRQQAQRQQLQDGSILIRRLQISLHILGYFDRDIDGELDGSTARAALEYFDRNHIRAPQQLTARDIAGIEEAATNSVTNASVPPSLMNIGPAFRCDQKLSVDKQAICDDVELSGINRKLNVLYAEFTSSHSDPSQLDALRDRQKEFLDQRRGCQADRPCLKLAMISWIKEFTDDKTVLPATQITQVDMPAAPLPPPTDPAFTLTQGFESSLHLSSPGFWVIIASRQNPSDALAFADAYVSRFDSIIVFKSPKGPTAISVGWLNHDTGTAVLAELKAKKEIPQDSFLSDGQDYSGPVYVKAGRSQNSSDKFVSFSMFHPSSDEMKLLGANSDAASLVSQFPLSISSLPPATGAVALKDKADPDASTSGSLPLGTLLQQTAETPNWMQVQAPGGTAGWVEKIYVAPVQAPPTAAASAAQVTASQYVEMDATQKDGLKAQADILLSDVDAYLKTDPKDVDLTAIAEGVAEIKQFKTSSDYEALQGAIKYLQNKVSESSEFKNFEDAQETKRREASEHELAMLVSEAQARNLFMQTYLKNNITADSASDMAVLIKRYSETLKAPKNAEVSALNEDVNSLFTKYRLTSDFNVFAEKFAPTDPKVVAKSVADFPEDVANGPAKPLIVGEPSDYVMLYNDTADAPHVVKNLKGEFQFAGGSAVVCSLHDISDADIRRGILAYLTAKGAPNVDLAAQTCSESLLLKNDLIIGKRSQVLLLAQSYILPTIKLMQDGKLKLFNNASEAEIKAAAGFTADSLVALEADITKGLKTGFGIVRAENQSAQLCMVMAQDDVPPHLRALMADQKLAVLDALGNDFKPISMTADNTFIAMKKKECGSAYGDAKTLATLIDALKRDGISYHLAPLWIDESSVAKQKAAIAEEATQQIQSDAQKKRDIEDQQKIADKRAADAAAQKDAVEKQLHDQFGALARAKTDTILSDVKQGWTEKKGWSVQNYPNFNYWYDQQIKDGWELSNVEAVVHDYGTAAWDKRTLEAGAAEIHLNMKNRILGKTQDYCVVLGTIFDAEYSMQRAPFEAPCSAALADFRIWAVGNSFKSEWIAETKTE